jgi:hypothetical protein
LTGDSGTNRWIRKIEIAMGTAPTTKSQRQEALSTIRPERTMPKPPPTPNVAEISPIATPTFSRGNSSLMIPKLRGKTAPPAPDSARKAISAQMFHASAQPMQPSAKIESEITSRRSLPCWSPSFPSSGVATEATRRNTVRTHVTHVAVVFSSRWSAGSAGTTIVCCSAKAVPAVVRIASVTL